MERHDRINVLHSMGRFRQFLFLLRTSCGPPCKKNIVLLGMRITPFSLNRLFYFLFSLSKSLFPQDMVIHRHDDVLLLIPKTVMKAHYAPLVHEVIGTATSTVSRVHVLFGLVSSALTLIVDHRTRSVMHVIQIRLLHL